MWDFEEAMELYTDAPRSALMEELDPQWWEDCCISIGVPYDKNLDVGSRDQLELWTARFREATRYLKKGWLDRLYDIGEK